MLILQLILSFTFLYSQNVRKEFRNLTKEDWQKYKSAVRQLLDNGTYDRFVNTHILVGSGAHGSIHFLPWHRMFLREFEKELQAIDPTITVPYWQWSLDAQDPLSSPLFTDEYYLMQLRGDCSWTVANPTRHCLVRNYNPSAFGTLFGTQYMTSLTRSSPDSFSDFSTVFEARPHGSVHIQIGGRNGDMSLMHSPNDPIFWLHHSYIDKVWADRQKLSPQMFSQFSGTHQGNWVDSSSRLSTYGVTVESVFDTEGLGYVYEDYDPENMFGVKETSPVTTTTQTTSTAPTQTRTETPTETKTLPDEDTKTEDELPTSKGIQVYVTFALLVAGISWLVF